MRHCRQVTVCIAVLLLSVAVSTSLAAQQPVPVDSVLARATEARWTVRALTITDTVQGPIRTLDSDRVTIGTRTLSVADIEALDRRDRDEAATLAMAIGAGAMLGLVTFHAIPCGGDYGPCDSNRYIYAGGAAALGSIIGALLSRAAVPDRWEPIWSR